MDKMTFSIGLVLSVIIRFEELHIDKAILDSFLFSTYRDPSNWICQHSQLDLLDGH